MSPLEDNGLPMRELSKNKFHEANHFGKGLSKLEIARIQINDSIRMLFGDFHPISVHTIIGSAYQIVRDLAKKNKTEEYAQLADHIKPGHEKEFWSHINKAWTFFRHADKDPSAVFDGVDELVNDYSIVMAVRLYRSLEPEISQEMNIFMSWFMCFRPDILSGGPLRALLEDNFKKCNATQFTRKQTLALGKQILANNLSKSKPDGRIHEY